MRERKKSPRRAELIAKRGKIDDYFVKKERKRKKPSRMGH